jgi:hypothetical protein
LEAYPTSTPTFIPTSTPTFYPTSMRTLNPSSAPIVWIAASNFDMNGNDIIGYAFSDKSLSQAKAECTSRSNCVGVQASGGDSTYYLKSVAYAKYLNSNNVVYFPQGKTTMIGTDFGGYDIDQTPVTSANNEQECRDFCRRFSGCIGGIVRLDKGPMCFAKSFLKASDLNVNSAILYI